MLNRLTNRTQKPQGLWACLIVAFMLLGCAAQMNYKDGKELVAQDKVEEGLAKFQKAMLQDPQNLEYKQAYLQTKERAVYSYLTQADKFADVGQRDAAEKNYQRVLQIDPGSERALDGLLRLKRDTRHDQLINEASTKLDKKDEAAAKLKLSSILSENPRNQTALALQSKLTDNVDTTPIETELALAYKKKITIEFKDVTLKQVFEVISRTSGLNFMFDKDVKTDQRTSIFLRNSTIEEAIHMTLVTNQLEQSIENANTVLIYPNTPAKQKDYQQMMVQSFYLTNADAKAVAASLKSLLKTRDIVVDEKLNLLMVRDTTEVLQQAEKLIALQDIAEPEVMLEVEVLEVQRKRLLDLGIQWPGSISLTPLTAAGITASTTTGTTGSTGASITLHDLHHQRATTIGVGISPITINANDQDSDSNLLANPRIRVRNHEKAKILIGNRVPNITSTSTATGFVSQSINYVDVGLTLNVEPTIYLDDQVAIKVSLEVSNIVSQVTTTSGSVAYQIGTRNASTVLRLKDGENQVLAGLINDEDRRSANKVPGLGDLPLIGRLFGSNAADNQKTEIVLSITPHLIHNIQRPNASLSKFRSGTESSYYVRTGSTAANGGTPNDVPVPRPATNAAPTAPTPAGNSPTPTQPSNGNNTAAPMSSNTSPQGNIQVINDNQISSIGASSTGAQLQWQGPSQVKKGDAFALQLIMQSDVPINSLPLTIGFDTSVLQATSITEGVFLKQGGAQTSFTSKIDPSGQLVISDVRTSGGGATSPGALVTINFIALAPTTTTNIQLLSATPIDLSGRAVPISPTAAKSIQIQP